MTEFAATGLDVALAARLSRAAVTRGDLVGLVISPAGALGVATADSTWHVRPASGAIAAIGPADEELRPRWAVWSGQTAGRLAADGVRLATCWDIAAAHRLLFGGWRADPFFFTAAQAHCTSVVLSQGAPECEW